MILPSSGCGGNCPSGVGSVGGKAAMETQNSSSRLSRVLPNPTFIQEDTTEERGQPKRGDVLEHLQLKRRK